MAKMENSPISQCLYLHKTENVADDVAKSQSVYDTVESEFYSLIIAGCRKERIFFDHADLRCALATWSSVERTTGSSRNSSTTLKYSWNRTVIRDEHLQPEDQNS